MKFQGWYLCPVMSGEKREDGNAIPRLKTDLKSSKKEEVDVVTTSTDTVSTVTPPQAALVEYTINVPLVRPKQEFLQILQTVGATGEVFTKKEICFYLKEYIGSRLLYDPNDPRIVHCQTDPLGRVFGLDSFTINDVFELLAKHCTPMPDSCIKRRRHILSPSTQHQNRQLLYRAQQANQTDCYRAGVPSSLALSISVRSQSPITSTTPPETVCTSSNNNSATPETVTSPKPQTANRANRKRSRGKSSSESESRSSKRKASVSFQNETDATGYPWYFTVKMETSDESEVLSVQGKETIKVKDSSDDLWFVEEDQISVHIDTDDTFSVEYEVESDRDSDVISVNSDASSNTSEDLLVVCGDSDVEFWADSSSSESDEELTDADKWKCVECDNLNTPVQRFCGRCWKLRPGWLPEFRHQKLFRRSHSAPSGLSSSDSEAVPKRKRSRQRSSRNSRQASNLVTEFSLPSASYQHTSSSSSSSSSQANLSKRLSANSLISETTELNGETTPAGLSRYDSGIGMGPVCSSSQSSHKSNNKDSLIASSKQPLISVEAEDEIEVRTTLSNYRSSLSEQFKDLCMICLSKPKNSCIIHGKTSHQVCCYGCAKTLKKRGRTCPVCRRPIKHVTKNYLM